MRDFLKRFTAAGIMWTLAAGCLSHFVYEWTGKFFLAGLVFPVDESVWEHLKLVFFPGLAFMLIENRYLKKQYEYLPAKNVLGLLTGLIAMPLLFYGYTIFTGENYLWADILIFVICVFLTFLVPYFIRQKRWKILRSRVCIWGLWITAALFFLVSVFKLYKPFKLY